MADWRANVAAGVVGVSAGLSAYLPPFVCSGAPCSSCFACVGAGGAAASALVVGFVSRRLAAASRAAVRSDDQELAASGASTQQGSPAAAGYVSSFRER